MNGDSMFQRKIPNNLYRSISESKAKLVELKVDLGGTQLYRQTIGPVSFLDPSVVLFDSMI
jgi:hypothetical protein